MPSLLQLQYFMEIARQENMTDVANKYFISQSALSNSLLRLENELGIRIFDRVGRNLVLNDYGRVYLGYVETALKAINEGKLALNRLHAINQRKVSVAASSILYLGEIINSFLQKYPHYTFNQHKFFIEENGVMLPDVDFIIAGDDDFLSSNMDRIIFLEDRLWLRVPPNNPLAQKDSIYLIEAKDEKFINLPQTTSFTRFLEKLFKIAGFTPNVVAECETPLQLQLFRKNMGVVLHPHSTAETNFFDYGKNLLIKDDFARRKHCLYWPKDRLLSKAAIDFRSHLLASFSNQRLSDYEESSK